MAIVGFFIGLHFLFSQIQLLPLRGMYVCLGDTKVKSRRKRWMHLCCITCPRFLVARPPWEQCLHGGTGSDGDGDVVVVMMVTVILMVVMVMGTVVTATMGMATMTMTMMMDVVVVGDED